MGRKPGFKRPPNAGRKKGDRKCLKINNNVAIVIDSYNLTVKEKLQSEDSFFIRKHYYVTFNGVNEYLKTIDIPQADIDNFNQRINTVKTKNIKGKIVIKWPQNIQFDNVEEFDVLIDNDE